MSNFYCEKRTEFGNYKVLLNDKKIGVVKDYHRTKGIWELLSKCFKKIKKER